MFKVLLNCIFCATMIINTNMKKPNIQEYLTTPNKAQVIINNNYKDVEDLNTLNEILNEMLLNSHAMPALGISIHSETINAIHSGVWLKMQYSSTKTVNEMMFDELLIQVEPDFCGFNIIRGNVGIYDGRCYYINLANNMKNLYNYLISISH